MDKKEIAEIIYNRCNPLPYPKVRKPTATEQMLIQEIEGYLVRFGGTYYHGEIDWIDEEDIEKSTEYEKIEFSGYYRAIRDVLHQMGDLRYREVPLRKFEENEK